VREKFGGKNEATYLCTPIKNRKFFKSLLVEIETKVEKLNQKKFG
jgi:hypothetical protein